MKNGKMTIIDFDNKYPKREITIVTEKEKGSLNGVCNAEVHYRNYRGDLDQLFHFVLTGDRNAWFGIKVNFLYDQMMGKPKKEYKDSFNRIMKVKEII